jgi:hypothetical protein
VSNGLAREDRAVVVPAGTQSCKPLPRISWLA